MVISIKQIKGLMIVVIILTGNYIHAQVKIENVDFKVSNNKYQKTIIVVNYDIPYKRTYNAELYYTKNGGDNWQGPLSDIYGDILWVTEGRNKRITINLHETFPWLICEHLRFKIKLNQMKGIFTDSRDRQEYRWVKIGSQTWMAENLKATKYSDGKPIPVIKSDEAWDNLYKSDEACCWYKNDSAYFNKYGVLYSWAAALNIHGFSKRTPIGIQGVCPDGWHLPGKEELIQLEKFIKHESLYIKFSGKPAYPNKHLKSKTEWKDDGNGTDDFHFSGLPGGCRYSDGSFVAEGYSSYWHSATQDFRNNIKCYKLTYDDKRLLYSSVYKGSGNYVRCIKD